MKKSQSEGSLAFLNNSKAVFQVRRLRRSQVGSAAGFMLVSGGILALPSRA